MILGANVCVQGQYVSQLLTAEALVGGIGAWASRSGPRYLRLAEAIADLIARESTAPGCRLPAERELAQLLEVSRGTVVAAYSELAERGTVVRRQGSGTRVAGEPPAAPAVPRHLYTQLGRFLGAPAPQIDLAFGAPYVDDAVWQLLGRVAHVLRAGAPAHGYAPLGLPALRQGIADRVTAAGTPTEPDDVLVTSGAQGALALLTSMLVRPGDRVVVEAPTYPGAVELFSRAGASIVALPRDHAGPRPDDLRHALSAMGAAFVFLIPTCHNPTGGVMHEQRRRELLRVCREHDVTVIEDLTTADVVFDGESPPTLSALDGGERVITVGSFSKILWGGVRVGWVRAPRGFILRLGRLKAARDLGSGLLDQAAVVGALPDLDAIIALRRAMARERHDHLRRELVERLPEWEISPTRGGYSLWVRLPSGTGDELAAAAMTRGVAIASGSSSAPEDRFLDHVRLCYPAPPELLTEAAIRLEDAWRSLHGTAAGRTAVPVGA
jgi:DNA-binding transcriptional MocR family regulator